MMKSVLLNLVPASKKEYQKWLHKMVPLCVLKLNLLGLTLISVLVDISKESRILSWWIELQMGLSALSRVNLVSNNSWRKLVTPNEDRGGIQLVNRLAIIRRVKSEAMDSLPLGASPMIGMANRTGFIILDNLYQKASKLSFIEQPQDLEGLQESRCSSVTNPESRKIDSFFTNEKSFLCLV
nr:hypothetical protein HmN_000320100 [Hymenolepis microstoma]